jgi:hypothetical protein
MKKKHLFILCCAASLSAWIMPRAEAYSVIALASGSSHKGPSYEVLDYEHHNAPRSVVEKRAIEGCALEGGLNPRIVLSTGKPGYFAIADSKQQQTRIIGWSGPLSSPEAAAKEALANCKRRGGTDPGIHAQWADGVPGKH